MSNFPDTDLTVRVTREEGGAVGTPSQGETGWNLAGLDNWEFRAEFLNNSLGHQVPNSNTAIGSSTEPVAVGRKDDLVDDITSIQGVEVLGLVKIPQHHGSVFTTGSTEGAIGGDTDGVDITGMADVVDVQGWVFLSHVPNLNEAIPTSRDDQWGVAFGAETDTADPLGVAVVDTAGTRDGKVTLEVTTDIPNLDALIARARNNESVIGGEGSTHDITGVSDEGGISLACRKVPETHGLIPRGGKSKATVGTQRDVRNDVRMAI